MLVNSLRRAGNTKSFANKKSSEMLEDFERTTKKIGKKALNVVTLYLGVVREAGFELSLVGVLGLHGAL